ncbi:MAG TPA: TauD/TfdA family dioxygenase, partial [Steroidobacteraceae bacterium]
HSRSQIAPGLASPEERAALPPQCWRMAWTNPVNGRGAIYLASHAYAVEGMEAAAGKRLIDELMEAATTAGTSYLHQWREGWRQQQTKSGEASFDPGHQASRFRLTRGARAVIPRPATTASAWW